MSGISFSIYNNTSLFYLLSLYLPMFSVVKVTSFGAALKSS